MKLVPKPLATILLVILIILMPLFMMYSWGIHFDDDVYFLLQRARALVGGIGLVAAVNGLSSLLFSFAVGIVARLGAEPARVAAVLSALGWSATAFAFLAIGKGIDRLPGTVISALLICFNPAIIATLGGPVSWIVALSWWVIALLSLRRYYLMLVPVLALLLMLLPLPVGFPARQSILVGAFAWSLFLFFTGIGAQFLGEWLAANSASPLKKDQLVVFTMSAVFLFVGGYQIFNLAHRYQTKPEARWALENDVAGWIQMNTAPDALIGASEKIGYLANRPVTPSEQLISPAMLVNTEDLLVEQPVDYLVSDDTVPWQLLANSRWFRLHYREAVKFDAPYVAEAPYTIWSYQPPPPDLGFARALNARVPDRLHILGYQVDQEKLESENEAHIILYLESPTDTIKSNSQFSVKTRVLSPTDSSTLAEWDVMWPTSVEPENWLPGEQISEQISLSPLPDLEPGAYPLNISLTGPDSPEFWPISLDNDFKRLDRIQVGYVVVGRDIDLDAVQIREALYADQAKLLGFTASDFQPGEAFELTLFWQATDPLEGDYVVFTHILDSNGQLVANHDSVPENGRYPTPSWLPGMTIPDSHLIQLPADLPSGEYQVRAGMYVPETGERLAVVTADGSIPLDNAVLLTQFSIP